MSRKCQITGKKPQKGRSYTLRGIAKKKKGIGLNITGKNKRRFLPNLIIKRFWYPEENRFITLRLAVSTMRTIDKLGLDYVLKKRHIQNKKCLPI
ncbi:MAG: 50S ribosomal protein L28 [Chlamydiales bacterium]